MRFEYDPLERFRQSSTPLGLYARNRWMQLSETSSWKHNFAETVSGLFHGQLHNGSWNNSPVSTIQNLFSLHLTVRQEEERISMALRWLSDVLTEMSHSDIVEKYGNDNAILGAGSMPFVKGNFVHFLAGAVLFLSTVFQHGEDGHILRQYESLAGQFDEKTGWWWNPASTSNILRAFVVHPVYRQSEVVRVAVKRLAERQTSSGAWTGRVPFYLTVNALGHLDFPEADDQLRSAFVRLLRSQKKDGTWGRRQAEWNTFLVVHTTRKKEELFKTL